MSKHQHDDDAPFDPRLSNAALRTTKTTSWSSSQSLQRIEIPADPAHPDRPRVIESESRSINGRDTVTIRVTDAQGIVREYDSPDKLPPSVLAALQHAPLPTGTQLPDDMKAEMRVVFKDIVREFEKSPFTGKLDVRDIEQDLERAMRGEPTQILGKADIPMLGPLARLLQRGTHSAPHNTAERDGIRMLESAPRLDSDFTGPGPRDPFADRTNSQNRALYTAIAVVAFVLVAILIILMLR
jgi:hypothetical protein